MSPDKIERRLQLHMINLCLAAVGRREGDIRTASEMLLAEVANLMHDACEEAVLEYRGDLRV